MAVDAKEIFSEGMIYGKITSFKEKKYFDLRKYYTEKDSEEIKPSRKGISLSKEQFVKIFEAMKAEYDNIVSSLD